MNKEERIQQLIQEYRDYRDAIRRTIKELEQSELDAFRRFSAQLAELKVEDSNQITLGSESPGALD